MILYKKKERKTLNFMEKCKTNKKGRLTPKIVSQGILKAKLETNFIIMIHYTLNTSCLKIN
jgi:5-hydroxyisourate hydrolase-like protein (transthyretin family)